MGLGVPSEFSVLATIGDGDEDAADPGPKPLDGEEAWAGWEGGTRVCGVWVSGLVAGCMRGEGGLKTAGGSGDPISGVLGMVCHSLSGTVMSLSYHERITDRVVHHP